MLSVTEREIQAKIEKKSQNCQNNFLAEMYSREPPLSKTVDSISKCCIFIHYQLKIHDGNCSREWTCIFLKINFFDDTNLNAHNSAENKADLLLASGNFIQFDPLALTPNRQHSTFLCRRTHIVYYFVFIQLNLKLFSSKKEMYLGRYPNFSKEWVC